ncbi:hypothetical protein THF5H11_10561 [Vibrio jasicida]|nr:hypothetical protein THF5H11_10561 [Vibrio jasicida]CAH1607713.1 hypothetical protein THF5G08_40473 [Vibrio jasicida]
MFFCGLCQVFSLLHKNSKQTFEFYHTILDIKFITKAYQLVVMNS